MPEAAQRPLLRQSLPLILTCAGVFLGLLVAYLMVDPPVKELKRIEKYAAEGKLVSQDTWVKVGLYYGLVANVILAGLVMLTSPWLGKRKTPGMALVPAPPRSVWTRWHSLLLVAVVAAAAWMNAPRLFLSMWGDEDFNASRFILDEVSRQPDGSLKIEPRPWSVTLWHVRKPTNHLAYSAFARLTHETFFVKGTAPDSQWFSEPLLRAPVFVAGLLTLPLMVWSLRVWGMSGWWTVLLMLLHPWFVRFAVDGRGYGFVMLGAAVLPGLLGMALQTGRWRWWLLLGAAQFFIFWSNFQSVYLLAVVNLMVVLSLVRRDLSGAARWLLASRWLVGGCFAGLLILGWLSPCFPQLMEFMKKGEIRGAMDAMWWRDSLCGWIYGQPWHAWAGPENALHHAMSTAMAALPAVYKVVMALIGLMLMYGTWVLALDRDRRTLLVFILGGPALMLLHMSTSGNKPYPWYLVPFLPGLLMLAGAAFQGLARKSITWSLVPMTVVVAAFAWISHTPREMLRLHPIEASRESVAAYREIMSPRSPGFDRVMGGALSMFTEAYDPAMYRVNDLAEFQQLLDSADQSQRPLYFNLGNVPFLKAHPPYTPIIEVLEDPARFSHVGYFPGLMPFTSRDVYKYLGKTP